MEDNLTPKQGLNQLFMVILGFYDCVSTVLKYRLYQKKLSATALSMTLIGMSKSGCHHVNPCGYP